MTCAVLREPVSWPVWGYRAYAWAVSGGDSKHSADLALAQGVLKGDAGAETRLLRAVLPQLRVVANAILRNPADVDDAIQVSLMRVLEGLESYRGEAPLLRWARRVGTRACLRLQEQEARRLRVVDAAAAEVQPAVATSTATATETVPRPVAEYLCGLSTPQRQAVILRHVLDYTVPEIAELTGAPVDTVKSRLLFARRALRKSIRRDLALQPRREKSEAHG